MARRKSKSAASFPGLKFNKLANAGLPTDSISAAQFVEFYSGPESDLQAEGERACGLYGFIRAGTLGKKGEVVVPMNCKGIWTHILNSAFYVPPGEGSEEMVSDYLKNLPDLILIRRDGKSLLIELKTKVGRLSRGQKLFGKIVPVKYAGTAEEIHKLIKGFADGF